MVLLYNGTPAVYHAADRHLDRFEAAQTRYWSDLGVSSVEALVDNNLAPLCVRRDAALLGFFRRTACGASAVELQQFFTLGGGPSSGRSLRSGARGHRRHLAEPCGEWQDRLEGFGRSASGLVHVYSLLPPAFVDTARVCQQFSKGRPVNGDGSSVAT